MVLVRCSAAELLYLEKFRGVEEYHADEELRAVEKLLVGAFVPKPHSDPHCTVSFS